MTKALPSRPRSRRGLAALAGAVVLHAAVLGAIGLQAPQLKFPPQPIDLAPAVQVQMLPPLLAPDTAAGGTAPRIPRILPPGPSPLSGLGSTLPAPVERRAETPAESASADYPGFYRDGRPGCGREDMILLTEAERERCRAVAAAEAARRAAGSARGSHGEMLEARRSRPVDGLPPEKRAYYGAVLAAREAVRRDFTQPALRKVEDERRPFGSKSGVNVNVHVGCASRFGAGAKLLGALSCPLRPPTGFLTEEARVGRP